ncbi:MAG: amidohydrolase family protein [Clostridia bacterium]|nr:amidohydrolase family protein [Clostridia bacterium]
MDILIKNGFLLMPSGCFEKGDLLIRGEKIAAVGDIDCSCDTVIDAQGKYVTPGLIDAHCHVGMLEEGKGAPGDDVNETSELCTPELKGEDGVNPFDLGFEDALRAGVTTVVTGPGSANVIGGTFCALKTVAGSLEDKRLISDVALKAALGENPKRIHKDKCATRMKSASALRKELASAKAELKKDPELDTNLARVLKKELTLKIHAHRADDILTAIRICEEFDVNYTVDHCTEGHLIAQTLKQKGVTCIIGPTLITRLKVELENADMKNGGVLEQNGIECAITTDHPETPIGLLCASAAVAVRGGMSKEAALRAITVNPARICALDNVGELAPGKDADVAIFPSHPFDICSAPEKVIVLGKIRVGSL